jgi:type VI secretion system secreted protein VgrG
VTGPPGEEIYVDKYGRVKVQFFWDRLGKLDDNSSCWIRVTEQWAGKGWGVVAHPRIGQEVVVDFLEGDPDRPLITGRVYNAEQMPPVPLPAGMVVSGIKSKTHKGKGYNELTLDDTAGKEKVNIHAQHDMSTTVEHDQSTTVHNNRTDTVDGTHTETIKKDTKITITDGPFVHDVAANTATYHVNKDLTENYDANQTTTVGKDQTTTVTKNITVVSTTGEILVDAAKKITLHTGSSLLQMDSSGKITIAGVNIVVIGNTDIKESAPTIEISGGEKTSIGVGNQNMVCDKQQVATSGAAIKASATGKHDISGGLVTIN